MKRGDKKIGGRKNLGGGQNGRGWVNKRLNSKTARGDYANYHVRELS